MTVTSPPQTPIAKVAFSFAGSWSERALIGALLATRHIPEHSVNLCGEECSDC